MSARATSLVWSHSKAQGTHRVVMLALAECANPKGETAVSQRDLAAMANIAKGRVQVVLSDLVDMGEIRKLDTGAEQGRQARYRLTLPGADTVQEVEEDTPPRQMPPNLEGFSAVAPPAPAEIEIKCRPEPFYAHKEVAVVIGATPQGITNADVSAILDAAGVQPPPGQPLFWARREHRQALEDATRDLAMSVPQIVDRIREKRREGSAVPDGARTMRHVLSILTG